MARPRKDQEGPTAVERMEEAFWEILAEKPYAQITVSEIAKRAQVNKNAFYYHFDGLGRARRAKRWTTCSHARWRACC